MGCHPDDPFLEKRPSGPLRILVGLEQRLLFSNNRLTPKINLKTKLQVRIDSSKAPPNFIKTPYK